MSASRRTWMVLGSNCFSGSHFVDLLLSDPSNFVVGVSRSPEKSALALPYLARPRGNYQFHQINLVREPQALLPLVDELEPAFIVNFAALSEVFLSNERPVEFYEINTLAVVKLLHELRRRRTLRHYLHVSSAEVYGPCALPVKESAPLNPTTAYAASKAAADLYIQTLILREQFPASLIRSTNVYGAHQQLFKLIPRTIIRLKQGQPIELHAGGKAIRTFIHIRDVAQGILQAALKGSPGKVYHFTTDSGDSVAEAVRKICHWMGRDFEASTRSVEGRPNQDSRYWLDDRWTRQVLGWADQISFEEGVRDLISWVEENWEEILRQPHEYIHTV